MPESPVPAYITSLLRHFEDLRDGTHGGSARRKDKEAHFEKAVQLLAPIARQVLTEMNTSLLLNTGQLTETGLRRTADGGLNASWTLSLNSGQPGFSQSSSKPILEAASTTHIFEERQFTTGR